MLPHFCTIFESYFQFYSVTYYYYNNIINVTKFHIITISIFQRSFDRFQYFFFRTAHNFYRNFSFSISISVLHKFYELSRTGPYCFCSREVKTSVFNYLHQVSSQESFNTLSCSLFI